MNKLLRNFIAEIAVATVVTLILGLTRGYSALFLQVLPLLYLIVVCEIATKYALSDTPK